MRLRRFQDALGRVSDIERVLHRIGVGAALPREVVALRRSLEQAPVLRELLADAPDALGWLSAEVRPCDDAVGLIATAVADEPQGELGHGGVMRPGFSRELDELRAASS